MSEREEDEEKKGITEIIAHYERAGGAVLVGVQVEW